MADDNPILAALELKALGASHVWSFHVSDIVLTAALLAGGAGPIHKLMDTFRKFMEVSSASKSGRCCRCYPVFTQLEFEYPRHGSF
jgi:hypothetical protein